MNLLDTPIEYLKGVGPQRGDLLKRELQIFKYSDLLHLFPFRYIDKTKYYKINQVFAINTEVQLVGKIIHIKSVEQKKGKSRLVATFVDETGQMELVWFQGQKWVKEQLKLNVVYVIFGKVTNFNGVFNMAHPEMEVLEEHKANLKSFLQPVYPSTEKLTAKNINSKVISKLIYQILLETNATFNETLPPSSINELHLISKSEAMVAIHFPKNQEQLAKAQFRLKFEELFFIQLQLISKNSIRKLKIKGHPFELVGENFTNFYNHHLPFPLTNAQKRVVKEIRNDLGKPAQMNRLLQGDVGSGKTIVAFLSTLLAKDNGFQSCILAPTEILASQHFVGINELAQKMNISVRLLTGSTKIAQRRIIHEELENGTLDILIGTHAILEDKVQFQNLGLAIIDEQHRFGVEQRSKLWKKSQKKSINETEEAIPPHILVMTATPIPRTLAMSLYGDLDVSVIDELPPGRKPIQTLHQYDTNRAKVWQFVKDEIFKGRQVYIVYPLIQESEKLDFKNLEDGYNTVKQLFPEPKYKISMVHGKLKPAEKELEMQKFISGDTNIMVATTVIEVGVNVPNASVMIIESAERFGLSQLHQLRGRVGRGAEQSFCVLVTDYKLSDDSRTRMETMVRTQDGFEIAEVDLKLRGPGDLMGTQQSGILNLQIADLVKDQDILKIARHMAVQLLKIDPALEKVEHQKTKQTFYELSKKKNIWNYIS